MNHSIPTRKLPERPDLGQLKRQAKELLEAFLDGGENAVAEVNRFYTDSDAAKFALHDAQLVLARSYGYDSWPKLKAYVDGVNVHRLVEAVQAGDVEQVRAMLRIRPELTGAWHNWQTALHYAVLGRMPEMVRLLMESGANARAGVYPHEDATTALTLATERGYDDIAAIIREEEKRREPGRAAADDVPAELRRALQTGDEDLAVTALEQHPELARFSLPGRQATLLHMASALLLPRFAACLLDHGANANARAKDGSTPLDMAWAAMRCRRETGENGRHCGIAARTRVGTHRALGGDSGG